MVMIQGKLGESTADLFYDGRAKVMYQQHFERDGVRYRNQWDNKRDDTDYVTNGRNATASGTMRNANQWKEKGKGWENINGSKPLADQPFTFSGTCN